MKRLTVSLSVGIMLIFLQVSAYGDIFRYQDETGVWHFTNINRDKRYKLFIRSDSSKPAVYIQKYGPIIDQASERFNIESSLIKAIIKAESDFDNTAISEKGAQGLMQLMPGTSDDMAVQDPFNPEQNIFGGARYLSTLLEQYQYDVKLALAAYNAGPERVKTYKGVPPFDETRTFIKKVLHYYEQFKSEGK